MFSAHRKKIDAKERYYLYEIDLKVDDLLSKKNIAKDHYYALHFYRDLNIHSSKRDVKYIECNKNHGYKRLKNIPYDLFIGIGNDE